MTTLGRERFLSADAEPRAAETGHGGESLRPRGSRGRLETSIGAVRRQVAQALRRGGIDTPDLDARLIVGHALGLDHTTLVVQADRILAADETEAVAALTARRLAHEPIARIVGRKEFWGLELGLAADTLVPRPETETVVEAALDALEHWRGGRAADRVLDLGTGSGALLLALLSELPQAQGVGTDVSSAALACARANAAALGMAARTAFVACDYGAALRGPFDLVVSNPPYIPRDDIATLAPEVRCFDPRRALDGGADGLDGYRAIAADAPRLLAPGGILVVELGIGLLASVEALLAAAGLTDRRCRKDLAGVPRALVGRLGP